MYQEKEKQRKLKKREENLILESQLVKDQKKSKKKKFLNIGSWIPQFCQEEKSKACFATFVELKTRFYVAIKMPDRSKNSMLEAIKQLTSNIPKEAFKTFTSDRGKEFSCWKKVEEMGIDFYFADPYCSWQRGCNENSNGLLREF